MQIYTYKKIRVTSFLLLVFSTATFLIPITASQQGSNPSSVAKKYLCTWPGCGKSFARSFHLKRHKLTHTGEKAFTCNVCGEKFALKNSLKRHKLTHTGEKPFTCNVCGKKFALKSSLERHKLTHTGEKAFTCNVCEKKFALKGALKRHKRTHADDSELVRALKKINQAIVNHKLKMDEETRKSMPSLTPEIEQELLQMAEEIEKRPYECGWPGCGKRFSFHTNLIRHKKIHTRKTLYECNVL